MSKIIMQNKKTIKKQGYTSLLYLTEELKEIEADVFVKVIVLQDEQGKYIRIDRG